MTVGPLSAGRLRGAWDGSRQSKALDSFSEGELTLNGSPIRLTAQLALGPPRHHWRCSSESIGWISRCTRHRRSPRGCCALRRGARVWKVSSSRRSLFPR